MRLVAKSSHSSPQRPPARAALRLIVALSLGMSGCGVVHDTAVGSYQVATAPFRLFHHSTPTPTPAPPPPASVAAQRKRPQPSPRPGPSPGSDPHRTAAKKASPSATPANPAKKSSEAATSAISAKPTDYPTAKPVPDKPGYVFS